MERSECDLCFVRYFSKTFLNAKFEIHLLFVQIGGMIQTTEAYAVGLVDPCPCTVSRMLLPPVLEYSCPIIEPCGCGLELPGYVYPYEPCGCGCGLPGYVPIPPLPPVFTAPKFIRQITVPPPFL